MPSKHADILGKLATRDLGAAMADRLTVARPYAKAAFANAQAAAAPRLLVRGAGPRCGWRLAMRASQPVRQPEGDARSSWPNLIGGIAGSDLDRAR